MRISNLHIHNLGRAWLPILMLVLAVLALACGGAAEAPAMAPAAQHADDSTSIREWALQESSPEGALGPAGAPGPAGADGPESLRGQPGIGATLAYSSPAAAAAPTAVPMPAQQQSAPAAPAAAPAPSSGGASQLAQPQSARKLIVESWISLEVTDIDANVRRVESLAVQSGGWVESSEVFGEAGYRSATVRIRVPADRLDKGLESLRTLGRVTDEGVSSTDVTARLIDNEARLKAWYAQEERLVTLLENAPTVEDIIQIEQRIAEVRSDIEHVEATQRDLTGRVATSLITVNLRLPGRYAADPPVGNLDLSTGDPSAVADTVIARVEALDGYVGRKHAYDEGGGRAVIDLIVFVKPADLAPLMDYAATLGAPAGRQLTSVGPAPLNEVPNARFTLAIRSNVDLEASLALAASDPLSVAEQIRQRAESLGGYVDSWSETRRDEDEFITLEMALVVKSSDLRDIMEYGASLGDIDRWNYNAVGQDPTSDAPDARLQVSVFTEYSDAETWIIIGVVVAVIAVLLALIVAAIMIRRRSSRGNRPTGVDTATDLEPASDE